MRCVHNYGDILLAGERLLEVCRTDCGGGNRKENTMKRIAILMLALLMPLAAFAGTKKLTCGKTRSLQIVLDEDASTALVTHEPLATATFTSELVTWSFHMEGDNGYTTEYKLNRMTGILYTTSTSDAKTQHDNYGNRRPSIYSSSVTCEISQQKF
jgi:hypothetical protein